MQQQSDYLCLNCKQPISEETMNRTKGWFCSWTCEKEYDEKNTLDFQSDYFSFTCDECNKPTNTYYEHGDWINVPKIICWRCYMLKKKERWRTIK